MEMNGIQEMYLILEQDDAAPDSLEYFTKEFLRIVGVGIQTFKSKAKRHEFGGCINHDDGIFVLQWCEDRPFYWLFEIEGMERSNGRCP